MLLRPLLSVCVSVCVIGCLVACEDGPVEGEGDGGEGEGEGEGGDLDDDQVRLGSALTDDDGAPAVDEDALPRPPDGVVVYDLGNLAVGENGETGTVDIDVDDRVTALSFVVYGEEHVILARAEDGGGNVVVDDRPVAPETPGFAQANALSSGFPAQFYSPGRVLPGKGAAAFPLPSSPDIALSAGTWSVRFGHFVVGADEGNEPVAAPHPAPVRVLALVRTAPVAPGKVKLALHFTGADGLSAEQALAAPGFQSALDLLQESWGAVGVDASDVLFLDMEPEDGAEFTRVALDEPRCDGGDLDDVVQLGLPDRLNVFFIEGFDCGAFGPFLLGMSPGIPGIPYAAGTPRSGVVVASSFLASDPRAFAVALAHETAHFLGLYHSQENDAFSDDDLYDNVADTGEKPLSRQNLMFYDVSRIAETVLTPGQGLQMQRNPLVLP